MREIQISKFKATCLAVLEQVRKSGEPVLVTRRGVPMARIEPARQAAGEGGGWIGSWGKRGAIVGDIVAPASEISDWEAMRE